MKTVCILIIVLFLQTTNSFSQRYLTPIFSETEKTVNVEYGSAIDYQGNNQALLLDFYEPKDDTADQRPLIIYAHGGGFTDQTQTKSLIHIVAYCDSMARRGYAVASIDYRLDESICNRAVINAMHDMKAAIRFFKKEQTFYKIDESQIFLAGESAGAITALTSNYINQDSETAFPPTPPMASDNSADGNSGNSGFSSEARATLCFCGGTATVLNELLFDTLAMQTDLDPPLLQVHGTADLLIPITKALDVAIRANNLSLPSLFYPLSGATHCPWYFPLENSWAYLDTLIGFSVPFLYAAISETTSIDLLNKDIDEIKIYPNPSRGTIYFELLETNYTDLNINIINSLGRSVYNFKPKADENNFSIKTNLPQGIYYIIVSSNEGKKVSRLIIKE